jgi:SOS-response transcriptional repressor LexA
MIINLGDRIRIARKRAGLTQEKLAEKIGITYPTMNKYERGHRIPSAELLARIAKILGCDPGWLLSGEGSSIEAQPVPALPTPVLNKVPEKFPEHVSEETVEYLSLPDVPRGAFSFVVKGESMSPAIRDNDYVIFIPKKDIKNGDIIVANNEWGEFILRRYRKKNSNVLLVSDNPEYPLLKPEKGYKIIGKVIAVWRKVKI